MTETTNSISWMLAQLKPNGFAMAARNLARQGFEHFMPMRIETAARGSRFEERQVPLFPGYLFVGQPAEKPWRPIRSTLGISRLVTSSGSHPVAVPETLIEAMRGRCDDNGVLMPVPELRAGMEVRIARGPMYDLVARIEEMAENDRIIVLLDVMGRAVRSELSSGDVEAITAGRA